MYLYAAGTTTPQSAYQDTALTLPYSNPIVLDAAGNVPAFYLADGSIKIRLADAAGLTILAADNLLVIGPSSGGGGGASVDATTVLTTGDLKYRHGTGTLSGFVRGNGRTIGSATSGATERANSDAQSLFEYLWTADANLSVSTGRGATANADWTANKTIALPDYRGRVLAAMDDMGNTAAGRLTTAGSGIDGTTLGAAGGEQTHTLIEAETPAISKNFTPTGTVAITSNPQANGQGAPNYTAMIPGATTTVTMNAISLSWGGGGSHNNTQPSIAITVYIKL